MDVAIWNVLHDGEIVAAEGSVPGELRLSILIAYLCDYLPTKGDLVVVTLFDCVQFEYRPYDELPVCAPTAVAALGLELLTAHVVGACVSLECADGGPGGQLLLQYSSAHVATAEGRLLLELELNSAAERYWSLWEQIHENKGST